MENAENAKSAKNAVFFSCEKCDFSCRKKSDWNRHINTQKHILAIEGNILENKKTQKEIYNLCNICNKQFKSYSGLWKHKNKSNCINNVNTINNNTEQKINLLINENCDFKKENTEFKTIIMELMKSNNDLQKQMIDLCKQIPSSIQNSTINSNNNSNIQNNNNKTFNLQVFLNEECKDAMNLSEFINSLQVQLSDLDNMGSLGYTEGISKIILKEMNVIDQNKRPVHCTDIKRDTLYVKDEDKWEKEQPEYPKLKQAIRKVEQKNFGLMGDWQAEHPDYKDSSTYENTEYLNLVSHAMSGTPENMQKVIKKIAKEVVIDK